MRRFFVDGLCLLTGLLCGLAVVGWRQNPSSIEQPAPVVERLIQPWAPCPVVKRPALERLTSEVESLEPEVQRWRDFLVTTFGEALDWPDWSTQQEAEEQWDGATSRAMEGTPFSILETNCEEMPCMTVFRGDPDSDLALRAALDERLDRRHSVLTLPVVIDGVVVEELSVVVDLEEGQQMDDPRIRMREMDLYFDHAPPPE